jgi:hypothetical protein
MAKLKEVFESFSLSGAIIVIFTSITLLGIVLKEEKVWNTSFTALTTFVSGKSIGKSEAKREKDQSSGVE